MPNSVIHQPIFIVGHQGNGATIISRIIRRSHNVLTFSGNYTYFTGADEMQSGMGLFLDYRLTGLLHKIPKSNKFGPWRGWSYGCNELLPFYKFNEHDFDDSVKGNIIRCIKTAILSNRVLKNEDYRFLDKSQSYALKIPLLRKALIEFSPRFIGIVRNPLAVCWRAAYVKTGLSRERISTEEKLKVAVEHWNNSIECMLMEAGKDDFLLVKIEDLLANLEIEMPSIFEFIDIDWDQNYLPQYSDILPYGTKRSERWYPVQSEINNKYIGDLPIHVKEYILDRCSKNMKKIGYI